MTTTTNIENKLPIVTKTYAEHESQVFANMHLSASTSVISALLKGDVQANNVNKVIFVGKILEDWWFLHISVHTTLTQDFAALF